MIDEAVSHTLAMWACIGDALDKATKAAGVELGPHFDEVRSMLARVEGVGSRSGGHLEMGNPTEFAGSMRLRRATVVALQWWARTAGQVHIRSPW